MLVLLVLVLVVLVLVVLLALDEPCGTQLPAVQMPPGQGVLSDLLAGVEHVPVIGSHVPGSWQASGAGQTTGLVPVQTPAWHASVWVQALPSSHAVPSVLAGLEQPVAGLQTPATWQGSIAAQSTALLPLQTPAWQTSVWVQASPSSQIGPVSSAQVPLAAAPAAMEQASQAPAAQAVLQHTPSAQKPLWQSSSKVHGLPSRLRS